MAKDRDKIRCVTRVNFGVLFGVDRVNDMM